MSSGLAHKQNARGMSTYTLQIPKQTKRLSRGDYETQLSAVNLVCFGLKLELQNKIPNSLWSLIICLIDNRSRSLSCIAFRFA